MKEGSFHKTQKPSPKLSYGIPYLHKFFKHKVWEFHIEYQQQPISAIRWKNKDGMEIHISGLQSRGVINLNKKDRDNNYNVNDTNVRNNIGK